MTADEKLARLKIKVDRAKNHFEDLNRVSSAFFATNPYSIATKRDPQSRRLIYYVSSVAPVPDEFAVIAADVIHNLRVALDHLARQLFLMGPDARPNAEVNFPFRNDATQFQSFLRGAIKSLRQDAIEALRKVEP